MDRRNQHRGLEDATRTSFLTKILMGVVVMERILLIEGRRMRWLQNVHLGQGHCRGGAVGEIADETSKSAVEDGGREMSMVREVVREW